MKKVYAQAQVDEAKCIGDKICENVCPTGAIKVVDKKARVDETKCAACLKCFDACDQGAVTMVRRTEPLMLATDPDEANQAEIQELCRRARFDPEEPVCLCTMTLAKEAAAAVLNGAKTPEEVVLGTGMRTSCGMWCMAPILRLLRANGLELSPPKGYRWYPAEPALWDLPAELDGKYPEYHFEEDRQLFLEGKLPNMINLLKK